MKNTKTIDVDATVTPTNEPGERGKVEQPTPEAKPPATKEQILAERRKRILQMGAAVKEFVWMNYHEPSLLHDSRFVGDNYTDRQRVKRKMERWKKNFIALPADERWAMFAALASVVDDEMPALLVNDQPKQTTLI